VLRIDVTVHTRRYKICSWVVHGILFGEKSVIPLCGKKYLTFSEVYYHKLLGRTHTFWITPTAVSTLVIFVYSIFIFCNSCRGVRNFEYNLKLMLTRVTDSNFVCLVRLFYVKKCVSLLLAVFVLELWLNRQVCRQIVLVSEADRGLCSSYEFVVFLWYCGAFYIFRSSGGVKIKILQHLFVNTLWLTWDIGPFMNEQIKKKLLYPLPKYRIIKSLCTWWLSYKKHAKMF
jgi:hypothetical protein